MCFTKNHKKIKWKLRLKWNIHKWVSTKGVAAKIYKQMLQLNTSIKYYQNKLVLINIYSGLSHERDSIYFACREVKLKVVFDNTTLSLN